MPHPCPHHCPPERGKTTMLAILAVIVLGITLSGPVIHAAETILEIAAALGLAAAVTVLVVVTRRRDTRLYPLAGRTMRVIPPAQRQAITATDDRLPDVIHPVIAPASHQEAAQRGGVPLGSRRTAGVAEGVAALPTVSVGLNPPGVGGTDNAAERGDLR